MTKKTLQISQIDSNSNIKLSNSECIYVLTAIDKYALVQIKNNFDYPGIKLTTEPGSTNVYLLEYDGKNITGAVLLWSYPETYSYKTNECTKNQMIITSDKKAVVILAEFVDGTTFANGIQPQGAQASDYFLALFTLGQNEFGWIQTLSGVIGIPVLAVNYPNYYGTKPHVYITGTFESNLVFEPFGTSISSDQESDMFLAKISLEGNIEWIISSDEKSTGSITAESITFGFVDRHPRLTLVGKFNDIISFRRNNEIMYLSTTGVNMWIAQFDLEGNIVWMNSPQTEGDGYISPTSLVS
ncbi:MAG TPA: hypothetical protein VKR58_00485, partial [Aquella sp.]|nr:hypothetical protein [Aquella sp.]